MVITHHFNTKRNAWRLTTLVLCLLIAGFSSARASRQLAPPDSIKPVFEARYDSIQFHADTLLERWFPNGLFHDFFELHCATGAYNRNYIVQNCVVHATAELNAISYVYHYKSPEILPYRVAVLAQLTGYTQMLIQDFGDRQFTRTDLTFFPPTELRKQAATQFPGIEFTPNLEGRTQISLEYTRTEPQSASYDRMGMPGRIPIVGTSTWKARFCYVLATAQEPSGSLDSCTNLYYFNATDGSFVKQVRVCHSMLD